jgi:hypothetical protein
VEIAELLEPVEVDHVGPNGRVKGGSLVRRHVEVLVQKEHHVEVKAEESKATGLSASACRSLSYLSGYSRAMSAVTIEPQSPPCATYF